MRDQHRGFAFSFGIHSLLLALFAMGSGRLPAAKQVTSIDIQLLNRQLSAALAPEKTQSEPRRKEAPAARSVARRPASPPSGQKIAPPAKETPQAAETGVAETQLPGEIQDAGASSLPNSAKPQGDGNGKDLGQTADNYTADHFNSIQNGIQMRLHYPPLARKMGWEGKVLVCFVICKNGRVEDLRVVKSSGFQLLDTNALEAIRRAAPYPNPPARVEITVPVVYRLKEA